MTYKDIIIKDLEDTSRRLLEISQEDDIIKDIDNLISDKTLKHDYYDIIKLDIQIIEYALLSLKMIILNDIEL